MPSLQYGFADTSAGWGRGTNRSWEEAALSVISPHGSARPISLQGVRITFKATPSMPVWLSPVTSTLEKHYLLHNFCRWKVPWHGSDSCTQGCVGAAVGKSYLRIPSCLLAARDGLVVTVGSRSAEAAPQVRPEEAEHYQRREI